MNWLAFIFSFTMAVLPQNDFQMYEPTGVMLSELHGYTDFNLQLLFLEHLIVQGGVRTHVFKDLQGDSYFPDRAAFRFGAAFKYDWLEIGYRRECEHPIYPFIYNNFNPPKWESAYDEVYITIEKRFDVGRSIKFK